MRNKTKNILRTTIYVPLAVVTLEAMEFSREITDYIALSGQHFREIAQQHRETYESQVQRMQTQEPYSSPAGFETTIDGSTHFMTSDGDTITLILERNNPNRCMVCWRHNTGLGDKFSDALSE